MSQIALPLSAGQTEPLRLVLGDANRSVIEACAAAASWPFKTAVLTGPPRAGKSLIARLFAEQGLGEAIDDADRLDETAVFHRWNRAQEAGTPLLLVTSYHEHGWRIALPDLASRIGAALPLQIGTPDDAMLAELIQLHGEQRALLLGPDAPAYLAARSERSHLGAERLVALIDRLSLERKAPPTQAIWREALEQLHGPAEPRLL